MDKREIKKGYFLTPVWGMNYIQIPEICLYSALQRTIPEEHHFCQSCNKTTMFFLVLLSILFFFFWWCFLISICRFLLLSLRLYKPSRKQVSHVSQFTDCAAWFSSLNPVLSLLNKLGFYSLYKCDLFRTDSLIWYIILSFKKLETFSQTPALVVRSP